MSIRIVQLLHVNGKKDKTERRDDTIGSYNLVRIVWLEIDQCHWTRVGCLRRIGVHSPAMKMLQ